ncbi:MAG: glycosyltransferase [Candidatus Taylorbacteria bacterium]|nr:glycosyltransferase [Candidatus Taylorbacteria bacterium]
MKPRVEIAICAFNEEANIASLLEDIRNQTLFETELLKTVTVISDGSTDRTAERARGILDEILTVEKHQERLGKPLRLSDFYQNSKTDILIQLDADIRLANRHVLRSLINALRDREVGAVSGHASPLPPQNLIERIAYFGRRAWIDFINSLDESKRDRFLFDGKIIALKSSVFRSLKIPDEPADDVYLFYSTIAKKFRVRCQSKAGVYYKLPSSFGDYVFQLSRYRQKPYRRHFSSALIDKYESGNAQAMCRAFRRNSKSDISAACLYLFFRLISIFVSKILNSGGRWPSINSAKTLVIQES